MKVHVHHTLENVEHGYFVLVTPLVVSMDDGRRIEVPSGFRTDFSSSRFGRWNFLSVGATLSDSAIVHDYLYASGIVPRWLADRYFLEGLRWSKCSRYDQWKGYWGVRLFGRTAWNNHRRRDKKPT